MNLTLRYNLTQHASATSTLCRIIIFRGKYENDTEPAVSDIFSSTGTSQFKVYDKRFKTKFLYDKTHRLDTNKLTVNVTKVIKLYGHIQYDASQVDGTDHENGGVYCLIISNQATNVPTIFLNSRMTYVDN
jgi:hypothetical protein